MAALGDWETEQYPLCCEFNRPLFIEKLFYENTILSHMDIFCSKRWRIYIHTDCIEITSRKLLFAGGQHQEHKLLIERRNVSNILSISLVFR